MIVGVPDASMPTAATTSAQDAVHCRRGGVFLARRRHIVEARPHVAPDAAVCQAVAVAGVGATACVGLGGGAVEHEWTKVRLGSCVEQRCSWRLVSFPKYGGGGAMVAAARIESTNVVFCLPGADAWFRRYFVEATRPRQVCSVCFRPFRDTCS